MSHRIDPTDVLHALLLKRRGDIAEAAKAICRSPGVLYNKFSDSMPGNELTGREERAIADWTKSDDYVQAVCAYFGGVFFRLPPSAAADDDILESYLAIVARMGEYSADLTQARDDGIVDPDEFKRLCNTGYATMAAIQHHLAELETTVRELPKPIQIKGVDRR